MGGTGTLTLTELWDYRSCTHLLLDGPGQTSSSAGGAGASAGARWSSGYKHGYGDPWTRDPQGALLPRPGDHHRLPPPGARRPLRALPLPLPVPRPGQLPHHPEQRGVPDRLPHVQAHPAPGGQPGGLPGPGGRAPRRRPSGWTARSGTPWPRRPRSWSRAPSTPGTWRPSRCPAPASRSTRSSPPSWASSSWPCPPRARGLRAGTTAGTPSTRRRYLARLAWDPIVSNAQFALSERWGSRAG